MKLFIPLLLLFTALPALAHAKADFTTPKRVTIAGYDGNAMEPFLSRDGKIMFFNNLNAAPENTDIHYALRKNDLHFVYQGRVKDMNTPALEGVATMDVNGRFYLVSPRAYDKTKNTLYHGEYKNGAIHNLRPLTGDAARYQAPWFNMDIEVSANGKTLYIAENKKSIIKFWQPWPSVSNLIVAHVQKDGSAKRDPRSDEIMKHINTDALEYAAGISSDDKTLYFTRIDTKTMKISILRATRDKVDAPFNPPEKIDAFDGFVEGPTLTPDDCGVYYHKKVENERFALFYSRDKGCE